MGFALPLSREPLISPRSPPRLICFSRGLLVKRSELPEAADGSYSDAVVGQDEVLDWIRADTAFLFRFDLYRLHMKVAVLGGCLDAPRVHLQTGPPCAAPCRGCTKVSIYLSLQKSSDLSGCFQSACDRIDRQEDLFEMRVLRSLVFGQGPPFPEQVNLVEMQNLQGRLPPLNR